MPMAGELRSRVVRPAKRPWRTHYIDSRQQRMDTARAEYANQFHFKMRMYFNIP